MNIHKWKDVKGRLFARDQLVELERATARDVVDMNLAELREASGLTLVQFAQKLELVHSDIARVQGVGNDPMLSNLRRYVEALGGQVKVVAEINGKTVELIV
jgi:hypothetical protein